MHRFLSRHLLAVSLLIALGTLDAAITPESISAAFGDRNGAFVLIDCSSGDTLVHDEVIANTPHGPCSTFKIWNSLIASEEGLLADPDAPFWKWDGETRNFPGWNANQTWRSAFRTSCVPAFQDLARKIGPSRMQSWLDKIGYGNRDICGRPDAFWLPRAGQRTILISPVEQARLICRLLSGDIPASPRTLSLLKEGMLLDSRADGTLYGKTGSGLRNASKAPSSATDFDMGWLVGFSTANGTPKAYACLVLGPDLSGKDARHIVETIFKSSDPY